MQDFTKTVKRRKNTEMSKAIKVCFGVTSQTREIKHEHKNKFV